MQNKWIGRRGPVEYPPSSPDLTPMDFFLWEFLKDKIYSRKPTTIAEMRVAIEEECAQVKSSLFSLYVRFKNTQAGNSEKTMRSSKPTAPCSHILKNT